VKFSSRCNSGGEKGTYLLGIVDALGSQLFEIEIRPGVLQEVAEVGICRIQLHYLLLKLIKIISH
jgi:hypothetical protein